MVSPLGLSSAERVRRRADFERAYETGRRISTRFMTLFVVANGGNLSRLGVSASRRFGASVERNRAKRLVREVFRRHKITTGLDIIVVPRRGMLDASFAQLEIDFTDGLARRRGKASATKASSRLARHRVTKGI